MSSDRSFAHGGTSLLCQFAFRKVKWRARRPAATIRNSGGRRPCRPFGCYAFESESVLVCAKSGLPSEAEEAYLRQVRCTQSGQGD